MTIPPLSDEQLQAARQAATRARRRRAEVKAQLRTGELTFAQVMEVAAIDDVVAHIKVVDVLKTMPRVGEKRAVDLMERLDIAQNRRLRGLGPHQIRGLMDEFAKKGL
ncbi:integration host factor, actinobacterial type [Mariniluteicoccus endophyticus]